MLRSFGKIGPQIDQIWAWLSRGHRWSPGVRNPRTTGPSLLVNCYLEINFATAKGVPGHAKINMTHDNYESVLIYLGTNITTSKFIRTFTINCTVYVLQSEGCQPMTVRNLFDDI